MSPEKDRAAARLVNRRGPRVGRGSDWRGSCRHRGPTAGCGRGRRRRSGRRSAHRGGRSGVRARGRGWLRWRCRRPGLVVQSRGSPQRQGGLGRRDDRVGSPLAPGLAGLALEPAGQPGPTQPLDLMGVGPASQELEGVWVMSDPKAATQSGPRISGRASRRCMQAVRRCTRPDRSFTARLSGSPGPLVVSGGGHQGATAAAEPAAPRPAGRSWCAWRTRRGVRRLLGGHQDHGRAAPSEPCGQRHPGVTGRLHHHQHLGGVAGQSGPERFEFLSTRTELVARPHDRAGLVRTSRPMRSPARDVDPQTNLHLLLLPVAGPERRRSRRREGSTRHSLSEIASSRSRRWRHQVPNRAMPPRRRGPRPPPRSTAKESTTAAPIAIAAVTDERRSPMNLRGRPDPQAPSARHSG
jgi:hypothetical protein